MEHEPMIFEDLEPISIPVTLGKKKYLLREASEGAKVSWQNVLFKSSRVNREDGVIKATMMDGIAEEEPLLVSLCMFEEGPREGEFKRPVAVQTVRGWPARIVKPLYKKIKEISDLDESEDSKIAKPSNTSPNGKGDSTNPTSTQLEDTSSTSNYPKPLERDLITS